MNPVDTNLGKKAFGTFFEQLNIVIYVSQHDIITVLGEKMGQGKIAFL